MESHNHVICSLLCFDSFAYHNAFDMICVVLCINILFFLLLSSITWKFYNPFTHLPVDEDWAIYEQSCNEPLHTSMSVDICFLFLG